MNGSPSFWPRAALGCYAALAIGLLVTAPAWLRDHRPAPTDEGTLRNEDETLRAMTAAARRLGPGAVPYLIAQFEAGDAVARRRAGTRKLRTAILPKVPWGIRRQDESRRLAALQALASFNNELEAHANLVLPALTNGLQDANLEICRAAVIALMCLGPSRIQAVPALTAALNIPEIECDNASFCVHQGAAHILGQVGPPAAGALPELARLFEQSNSAAASEAAVALWHITHNPELIVPGLVQMLNGEDARSRFAAVAALRRIGDELQMLCPQTNVWPDADGCVSGFSLLAANAETETAHFRQLLDKLQARTAISSRRE